VSPDADIDVSRAVGDPDGFDRIWTPHRMAYIHGEAKPAGDLPFLRDTNEI
jgi:ATP adenylyltransferase